MSKKDFTYSHGCGCQVTFFAASDYMTSRMTPGPSCDRHTKGYQVAEREWLIEQARDWRDKFIRGDMLRSN